MTETAEKLSEELNKLPEEQQDRIAAFLLEDLKDEQRWTKLFANSQEELSRLADEAIEEFERGGTEPMEDAFGS